MKIGELLKNIQYLKFIGDKNSEFKGLCTDSQKVREGDAFICYKGNEFNSHDFAAEAVERGAALLICENKTDCDVPQIIVENGREAIADVARAFYGYADKKLKLVAVTGTNGKTTTTYMLASVFGKAGKKAAVIGTLGIKYADKFIAPELTTPDPIFLHSVFSDMLKSGTEYVFMEVSAHAIYFDKVKGLNFEVAIFTNCTQDHLDFFGSMQEYSECKKSFFTADRCKYAVINSDDGTGMEIMNSFEKTVTYGLKNPADVFAVDIEEKIDGSKFVINLFDELYEINLQIPAVHNIYNAMAAAACAKILGIDTDDVAEGLADLKSVTGRLELVAKFNGADIFVDFAHTPDGLEKSLQALKKLCKGKLYCLFGCGGNRDRTKRPVMGKVASLNADFCIVTSDNPRFEDPYEIISEIEVGMKPFSNKYVTVTDRETATEYAVNLLECGDILLVAGKGGEYYQDIMGIKHSYNDASVIKRIIG